MSEKYSKGYRKFLRLKKQFLKIVLYGKKKTSVKKAIAWLMQHDIAIPKAEVRKSPPPPPPVVEVRRPSWSSYW